MSLARRALVLLAIAAWPLVATGCYYNDYDLMTVDHYCHYGHTHSVDVEYYSSDGGSGCDPW